MLQVASAIILKNCRLLLLWENSHWKLPGGKVEAGESLVAALERKLLEELGQAGKIVATHSTLFGESFFGQNVQATHFWVDGIDREHILPQGEHSGHPMLWASVADCRQLVELGQCSPVMAALFANLSGLGVIK